MESIPASSARYLTSLNMAWGLGAALSAALALSIDVLLTYDVQQWKVLVWISTGLSLVSLFQRTGVLESPHYLYTIGDLQVYDIIENIAKINGKSGYKAKFVMGKMSGEDSEEIGSIFKGKCLRTTVVLSLVYLFSSFAYYSLLFFTPVLLPSSSSVGGYVIIISQQLGNY